MHLLYSLNPFSVGNMPAAVELSMYGDAVETDIGGRDLYASCSR